MGPVALGASVPFRVRLDGTVPAEAHGLDIDGEGNGTLARQRLHQLIRLTGPVRERLLEIEFLDVGARHTASRSAEEDWLQDRP